MGVIFDHIKAKEGLGEFSLPDYTVMSGCLIDADPPIRTRFPHSVE